MRRFTRLATSFLPALALAACTLELEYDPALDPDLESVTGELSSVRIIYNFNGDPRWVRSGDQEVKLFLSSAAYLADDPTLGFQNENDYKNSCGPTAALNVFRWYGIDELEGDYCYWVRDDVTGRPLYERCRPKVTAAGLGYQMKTNNWTFLGFTMPGTNTENFRTVYKKYVERYMPADYDYQYLYEEGTGPVQYNNLWATLEQGNPVVVNYKTGTTKGHFSVIVGIEKAGDPLNIYDDRIIMANPRQEDLGDAISYSKFHQLWRRDYTDFGALAAIGEHRYTRINLWDSTQPLPPPPTGGGGPMPEGPIRLK